MKIFLKSIYYNELIGEISINDSKSSFSAKNGPRINNLISAQQVRCIDSQGKQLGIISINEALQAASSIGLDLVEIQPNVSPPVSVRYTIKLKWGKLWSTCGCDNCAPSFGKVQFAAALVKI